jgi:hypothetical protein
MRTAILLNGQTIEGHQKKKTHAFRVVCIMLAFARKRWPTLGVCAAGIGVWGVHNRGRRNA